MKKIWILIDLQNDFVSPNGSLSSDDCVETCNRIVNSLDNLIDKEDYVICTQDTHYEDYLTTFEGQRIPVEHAIWLSKGWKINNQISDKLQNYTTTTVEKEGFGYEDWYFLADLLDEHQEIHIMGVQTDRCVITNALGIRAMFPNVPVYVHENLCCGSSPEMHKAAISVMQKCLIDIVND